MKGLILFLFLFTLASPALAQRRTAFMGAYQYEAVEGAQSSHNLSVRTHSTEYENGKGCMWMCWQNGIPPSPT